MCLKSAPPGLRAVNKRFKLEIRGERLMFAKRQKVETLRATLPLLLSFSLSFTPVAMLLRRSSLRKRGFKLF